MVWNFPPRTLHSFHLFISAVRSPTRHEWGLHPDYAFRCFALNSIHFKTFIFPTFFHHSSKQSSEAKPLKQWVFKVISEQHNDRILVFLTTLIPQTGRQTSKSKAQKSLISEDLGIHRLACSFSFHRALGCVLVGPEQFPPGPPTRARRASFSCRKFFFANSSKFRHLFCTDTTNITRLCHIITVL